MSIRSRLRHFQLWVATVFLYDATILVAELMLSVYAFALRPRLRRQQMGKLRSIARLFGTRAHQQCYWFHAVSLGEVKLAEALAEKVRQQDARLDVVITTITESGYSYAASRPRAFDTALYYPPDLSMLLRRFISNFRPRVLVIIESDFWPNQIRQTASQGIPILVANGRLSETSARRYEHLAGLGQRLLSRLDFVYAQNDEFAQRFMRAGVASQRIAVCGNLKFSSGAVELPSESLAATRRKWQVSSQAITITFGSVHLAEMPELANAIRYVHSVFHGIEFIIVPRHPELFQDLRTFRRQGLFGYERLSPTQSGASSLVPVSFVRQTGILKELYSVSDIGFVGGTFCEVNGHNLIEPGLCGIPVLFGPNTKEQQVLRQAVLAHEAGHQVLNGLQLGKTLQRYLEDATLYTRTCDNAKRMVQALAGVSDKLVHDILQQRPVEVESLAGNF